jgi:5'-nucleotidase
MALLTLEGFSDEPLQDALELLTAAGFSADVEPAREIYVNRDLRMNAISWVGFDMDYTLALYHQDELDALSVRHTVDTLIEHFGYPEAIRAIKPEPDFAIRGVVVDRKLGNILKLDSHYYVGRAYHGFQPVARELKKAYQDERIRLSLDRYVLVDTLFALPEAFLYAAIIDHLERDGDGAALDYMQLYDHIRAAIDLAHADGRIKRDVLGDIPRYVRRDPELAQTLHKLRSAGKHLFLLTNSEWYYTSELMSYMLDGALSSYPTWRNYFDVVITTAKKPWFFRGDDPFLLLDELGRPLREEQNGFIRGHVYEGGNLNDFQRKLGLRGSEVLYVGDHIYGDMIRSKRDSAWRTCMVIQEMEGELQKRDTMRAELNAWYALDHELAALNSDLSAHRRVLERLDAAYGLGTLDTALGQKVERARRDLKRHLDLLGKRRRTALGRLIDLDLEIAANFNPFWGFLFKEGAEHSFFGGQVEDYACIYTSRVSNLRQYSPLRYFRARTQHMPHEL